MEAGCRRSPPRVNGGRRRRGARADPAPRAGVSCWRCFCPTRAQRREDRPFAAGEVCRVVLLMSSQPSVAVGSYGFANCVSSALLRYRSDLVLGCGRGRSWRRHPATTANSSLSELGSRPSTPPPPSATVAQRRGPRAEVLSCETGRCAPRASAKAAATACPLCKR